jgi:hypothetical protein
MDRNGLLVEFSDAPSGLTALNKWRREVGINHSTAWRWRQKGWLETVNICGRQYVTSEAIAKFKRRAAAGEFAQEPAVTRTASMEVAHNSPQEASCMRRLLETVRLQRRVEKSQQPLFAVMDGGAYSPSQPNRSESWQPHHQASVRQPPCDAFPAEEPTSSGPERMDRRM